MDLYLLRHAIAEPRNSRRFNPDSVRPLTAEGQKRMVLAARGMNALGLRFDLILTSPFTRAHETARIVAAAFRPPPPVRVLRPLASGREAAEVLAGLASLAPDSAVVLAGHEPDLSLLAGALLIDPGDDLSLEFKKGGLCHIVCEGPPKPGEGRLIFHLTPKVLRRLGGESD